MFRQHCVHIVPWHNNEIYLTVCKLMHYIVHKSFNVIKYIRHARIQAGH